MSFGKENVGEFTIAKLATLVNLEFGWVIWQMVLVSPNFALYSKQAFRRADGSKT